MSSSPNSSCNLRSGERDSSSQLCRRPLQQRRVQFADLGWRPSPPAEASHGVLVEFVLGPGSAGSPDTCHFLGALLAKISCLDKYRDVLSATNLQTSLLLPDTSAGAEWIQVTPRGVEFFEGAGPLHPYRLLVSSFQVYQLQVMWPIVRTAQRGVLKGVDDPQLDRVLEQMLPASGYVICRGITDFKSLYGEHILSQPKGLCTVSVGNQQIHCESKKCLLWHKCSSKSNVLERRYNMCSECKRLDHTLKLALKKNAAVSSTDTLPPTHPKDSGPNETPVDSQLAQQTKRPRT